MGLRRAWHARFVRRSALARSRRRGSRVVRSCAFFFVRYFVFVRSFSTFRSLARSLAAPCPTGWQISQNSCAWSLHRYAPPHLLSLSLLCLQSVYGTPRVQPQTLRGHLSHLTSRSLSPPNVACTQAARPGAYTSAVREPSARSGRRGRPGGSYCRPSTALAPQAAVARRHCASATRLSLCRLSRPIAGG